MSKKEQIRLAAIKVIAKEGFFRATTDKIAMEADVAVGTLYNYFSNKDDILNYIFKVESQKRIDYYTKVKNSDQEWCEKIAEILTFHFQEIIKETNVIKIVLAERINANRSNFVSLKNFAKLPEIISEILIKALAQDKLRKCDVKTISIIIFGSIEAVMGEFIVTKDEEFLNQALLEICCLLENGLAK